jgi:hypothetical protein
MGLLDRARETRPAEEEEWTRFIRDLDTLNRGVDFSIALYRQFIRYFDIEKSALFFRIEEGADDFKCLSSVGYDKTTVNRLRLDKRAVDSEFFHALASEKRAVVSSSSELSFFSDYFSSREFGLMEDLYWLPFVYNGGIVCLIMVSQWNSFPPDKWELQFSEISRRFSDYIFISRRALPVQKGVSGKRISGELIRRFVEGRGDTDIHLFAIDMTALIERLMDVKVGMNRINLKKEIISVFTTMAGPHQGILDLDNQKVLFALDRARITDKGLFLHQLSASLPLLFQDLTDAPELSIIDLKVPGNEEEWTSLTGTLLR